MKNKYTTPGLSTEILVEAMKNLQYLEDDDLKALIEMASKEKAGRDKKAMRQEAKAKAKVKGQ